MYAYIQLTSLHQNDFYWRFLFEQDEDVYLQVLEAARQQEELRCITIVDEALKDAKKTLELECKSQISAAEQVTLTLTFKTDRS